MALTADSGAARAEIVPQNSPLGTISVLSGLPRFFSKPHIYVLYNDVLQWICFCVQKLEAYSLFIVELIK